MRTRDVFGLIVMLGGMGQALRAQQGTPKAVAPVQSPAVAAGAAAPVERKDPELDVASAEIGNALFLRCLCAENSLIFDANGHLLGPAKGAAAKTTDWTLAGVNVLKVERRPAEANGMGAIELDGVRVAIRYAPDRHEFDRHAQSGEKMKIVIADAGSVAGFRQALRAVFAMGIDQALQRSLPEYWQHYFNPAKAWEKDELTGAQVLPPNGPLPAGATEPVVTHKAEPSYTPAADRDKVAGTVTLRLFVDTQGAVRRVSIAQPLGYGLDERAVEASEKLRFAPATLGAGKPVNSYVVLREDFVVAANVSSR